MGCVLQAVAERSKKDLEPLTQRLLAEVAARNMTSQQAVEFLLSFVQSIRYKIPIQIVACLDTARTSGNSTRDHILRRPSPRTSRDRDP